METKKTYRIIISGGGSGGHIFPAIAIANNIKKRYSNAEILFVGAKGKMEMTRVPEAGYKIVGLWISGLQRRLTLSNLMFPIKVFSSIIAARRIIKSFKPDVAIGVGGYASGPLLKAANAKGIPTLIQEQNSYAGLTNKWLAAKSNTICVAYEGMEKYFPAERIVLTGNPVRSDIHESDAKRKEAIEFYNLNANKKTILAIGGSLGARTINTAMLNGLDKINDANVQLIWQIGKFYYADISSQLEGKNLENIRFFEFLKEMDLAYAAADVVISRAGALSISELCLVKKPVVFVPSPNVSEDHQTKNAKSLVQKDAALIVPDSEAPARLVKEAIDLLEQHERCVQLSENIGKMAKTNATDMIVDEIEKLII